MPNLPPWKAPKKLMPVTAEAYVALAMTIDFGTKLVARNDELAAKGQPIIPGKLGDKAASLYNYIPTSAIPLEEIQVPPNIDKPVEESDRASHYTFRAGKAKLMAALDSVTPASVKAELGDTNAAAAPGDDGGVTWWSVALAAGGVLSFLAKRTVYGLVGTAAVPLIRVAATLLYAAAAAAIITKIPAAAATILDKAGTPLLKPAGQALGWVVGIVGVGLGAVLVYKLATRPQTRPALAEGDTP